MGNQETNDFVGYYYSNPKLYKEVKDKESLIKDLLDKALKCPHCKEGHYLWEDNGGDYYGYRSWFECDKCGSGATPYRQNMIEDTNWYGIWDYGIINYIIEFECPKQFQELGEDMIGFPYKKTRDFDPKLFNKEKHIQRFWNGETWEDKVIVWEEFVEKEIKLYIEYLDKIIEKAKKYPLLRRMIKC